MSSSSSSPPTLPAVTLPADGHVIALPHFHRRADEVFFLISQRPSFTLSAPEAEVWDRLERAGADGVAVAELRSAHGVAVDGVVATFAARSAALVVEATPTHARRRVLVIEPHSDDAALSIGALMWSRRRDTEFVLATMGSRSNFSSYWNIDRAWFAVDEVTRVRNAEAAIFVRALCGRHVTAGCSEASLRQHDGDWTLDWFRRHRYSVYAGNNHGATEAEVAEWTAVVRRVVADVAADEVWMPLGVGSHGDHELTRNACLRVLADDPSLVTRSTVMLYQDVPYDSEFRGHAAAIVDAITAAGGRLEAVTEPIAAEIPGDGAADRTGTLAPKLALLGVFASQFKVAVISDGVRASAGLPDGTATPAEHLWRVSVAPQRVDEAAMYLDREAVEQCARWLRTHCAWLTAAGTVRLLVVQPAGRWAADVPTLLDRLPRARFEVLASQSAAPEIVACVPERVSVREIGGGRLAWPLAAFGLLRRRPTPTIVVSGLRVTQARLLARVLFTGRPLVVGSFDHFLRALAAVFAEASAP